MLGNDEKMGKRWEDIVFSFYQAEKLNVRHTYVIVYHEFLLLSSDKLKKCCANCM